MANNCPVCYKHIQNHAYKMKCLVCLSTYHLKCISITPNDHIYLREHSHDWYCRNCTRGIFPFNDIDDDKKFVAAVNHIDNISSLNSSDLIFHPFEINDIDHNSPLCEIDPDLCFYDSIDFDLSLCNYYCEFSFIEVVSKVTGSSQLFSLCHLNIRSIKQNLSHFEMYLKSLEFTFSFIGLSETWLRDETCELYCLDGYELVEPHRTYKSGGGVGLFDNHTIPFTQRNDLSYLDEFIQCVTIEIEKQIFNTPKNVIISVIYRPPNTDTRPFTENINIVLNIIKMENKICYFMGDYNINILNYDSHSETAQFVDLLYSYALLPLINRPTRISQGSATLINNIFTNNIDTIDKDRQGILVTDITDHFPVFYINSCHKQIGSNELHICRRNFCYDNKIAIQRAITETDWSEMYLQGDNVQCAFSLFHSKFVDLFERHFPKRKIKLTYNNRKPWLTTALKQSIRTKNRLYKKI